MSSHMAQILKQINCMSYNLKKSSYMCSVEQNISWTNLSYSFNSFIVKLISSFTKLSSFLNFPFVIIELWDNETSIKRAFCYSVLDAYLFQYAQTTVIILICRYSLNQNLRTTERSDSERWVILIQDINLHWVPYWSSD